MSWQCQIKNVFLEKPKRLHIVCLSISSYPTHGKGPRETSAWKYTLRQDPKCNSRRSCIPRQSQTNIWRLHGLKWPLHSNSFRNLGLIQRQSTWSQQGAAGSNTLMTFTGLISTAELAIDNSLSEPQSNHWALNVVLFHVVSFRGQTTSKR